MNAERNYKVGYGKPPKSTQFKKGRSGNPRGRPRNRSKALPHDHILGQMVTVRDDGKEHRITAAEAFLLHITKRGLEGDSAAARATLAAIESARGVRHQHDHSNMPSKLVWRCVEPGSVGTAASPLRIVTRYGRGENGSYRLNPWIVQKALDRMSEPLSVEDQRKVWDVTKDRSKVEWPHWWLVRG